MQKILINIIIVLLFQNCNSKGDKIEQNNLDSLVFIANIFNEDIPDYHYQLSLDKGFNLDKNKQNIIGLNIYDLNTEKSYKNEFILNHIYHISPINFNRSYSYIFINMKNGFKVFKFINCKDKGDSIEDVLNYIKQKLEVDSKTISNVKNYRSYGEYIKIDPMTSLNCN